MGLGSKIFIIEDDDSIHPIPFKRYERLKSINSDEKLPQYAGRRLRCTHIIIEYNNRKPDSILHADFYFLDFDSIGKIDESDRENEIKEVFNESCAFGVNWIGLNNTECYVDLDEFKKEIENIMLIDKTS